LKLDGTTRDSYDTISHVEQQSVPARQRQLEVSRGNTLNSAMKYAMFQAKSEHHDQFQVQAAVSPHTPTKIINRRSRQVNESADTPLRQSPSAHFESSTEQSDQYRQRNNEVWRGPAMSPRHNLNESTDNPMMHSPQIQLSSATEQSDQFRSHQLSQEVIVLF
jgi:hypothetical protein